MTAEMQWFTQGLLSPTGTMSNECGKRVVVVLLVDRRGSVENFQCLLNVVWMWGM